MDYPQWLLPTFIRSARAAGATAGDEALSATAHRLLGRWNEPGRHHHNLHHLADMLSRVTTLAPETHDPDLVRLATFYHGAVFSTAEKDTYTRNGGENEEESARVARADLAALGVPTPTVDRVATLITGIKKQPLEADPTTSTTLSAIDIDKLALRDAHLGSLATGPQKYTKYLDEVAQEYSHVPEKAFLLARQEIIGKLLGRRQIFLTPLGRQWESAARDNLAGERGRIESRLRALAHPVPTGPADTDEPALEDSLSSHSESTSDVDDEYTQHRSTQSLSVTPFESGVKPADHDLHEDDLTKSSLETMPEDSDPAPALRPLSAEQKVRAEREEIARKMQDRITRRQAGLPEEPAPVETLDFQDPLFAGPDDGSPVVPRSPSTPSADSPEEAHDSARAGFEREPDY